MSSYQTLNQYEQFRVRSHPRLFGSQSPTSQFVVFRLTRRLLFYPILYLPAGFAPPAALRFAFQPRTFSDFSTFSTFSTFSAFPTVSTVSTPFASFDNLPPPPAPPSSPSPPAPPSPPPSRRSTTCLLYLPTKPPIYWKNTSDRTIAKITKRETGEEKTIEIYMGGNRVILTDR